MSCKRVAKPYVEKNPFFGQRGHKKMQSRVTALNRESQVLDFFCNESINGWYFAIEPIESCPPFFEETAATELFNNYWPPGKVRLMTNRCPPAQPDNTYNVLYYTGGTYFDPCHSANPNQTIPGFPDAQGPQLPSHYSCRYYFGVGHGERNTAPHSDNREWLSAASLHYGVMSYSSVRAIATSNYFDSPDDLGSQDLNYLTGRGRIFFEYVIANSLGQTQNANERIEMVFRTSVRRTADDLPFGVSVPFEIPLEYARCTITNAEAGTVIDLTREYAFKLVLIGQENEKLGGVCCAAGQYLNSQARCYNLSESQCIDQQVGNQNDPDSFGTAGDLCPRDSDIGLSCPNRGGCCRDVGGVASCQDDVFQSSCEPFGVFLGDGSTCGGGIGNCPPLGACCRISGDCDDKFEQLCLQWFLYQTWSDEFLCDMLPESCPELGKCCSPDGACNMLTVEDCWLLGDWLFGGVGSFCAIGFPNDGSASGLSCSGACCNQYGACFVVPSPNICLIGGAFGWEYIGLDTTCDFGTCELPIGACCVIEPGFPPMSRCVHVPESQCVNILHGVWAGPNTLCYWADPSGAGYYADGCFFSCCGSPEAANQDCCIGYPGSSQPCCNEASCCGCICQLSGLDFCCSFEWDSECGNEAQEAASNNNHPCHLECLQCL